MHEKEFVYFFYALYSLPAFRVFVNSCIQSLICVHFFNRPDFYRFFLCVTVFSVYYLLLWWLLVTLLTYLLVDLTRMSFFISPCEVRNSTRVSVFCVSLTVSVMNSRWIAFRVALPKQKCGRLEHRLSLPASTVCLSSCWGDVDSSLKCVVIFFLEFV